MNMRYLLPTMSLYVTDDFLQVKKIYNSIARNTLYDFIAFFFRLSWGHCSYNANFNYQEATEFNVKLLIKTERIRITLKKNNTHLFSSAPVYNRLPQRKTQ